MIPVHYTLYRAFSYDVIAAMLDGKNNTSSLSWEIIFMQNCLIVSATALQHGRHENPLYVWCHIWTITICQIYMTVSRDIIIMYKGES